MKLINKIRSMDLITQASIGYVFVGFFQKGISIISGPIFTRILTIEEYGVFSVFNSWFEILGILTMLSLSAGVYNNGLRDFNKDRDVFTYSLLLLSNLSTTCVLAIIFVLRKYVAEIVALPVPLVFAMFFTYFFMPAMSFWIARQRYEYKYKLSCIVTIISTFCAVLFSLIITTHAQSGKVIAKVWSEKIILFLFWIYIYIYLAIKARFRINIDYWKYALSFTLPLIPHYIANYILNGMDRIMILNMVGEDFAAIYAVSYSAAFMIQIFWQSINAAIIPLTYDGIRNKNTKMIDKYVFPYISIYGCLCIIISFVSPEIMQILAPSSYREGVYLIPILMVGVFFTGMYCLFANVEFYYKSTKVIGINSMLSALCNVGLNYIFINKFGYQAAAYTTVICYFIQTLVHYINYRRVSKKIYNEKNLVLLLALVCISCYGSRLLYGTFMIRYLMLFILFCVLLFLLKTIGFKKHGFS